MNENNLLEANDKTPKKVWVKPEYVILDVSNTLGGPGSSIEDMSSYQSP